MALALKFMLLQIFVPGFASKRIFMVIFVIHVKKLGKKSFFEKKQFENLSGSQIAQKSILGQKNYLSDYII